MLWSSLELPNARRKACPMVLVAVCFWFIHPLFLIVPVYGAHKQMRCSTWERTRCCHPSSHQTTQTLVESTLQHARCSQERHRLYPTLRIAHPILPCYAPSFCFIPLLQSTNPFSESVPPSLAQPCQCSSRIASACLALGDRDISLHPPNSNFLTPCQASDGSIGNSGTVRST